MHFKIVKPRILSEEEMETYKKNIQDVKDFIDGYVDEDAPKEEEKEGKPDAPKEGGDGEPVKKEEDEEV